MELMTSNPATPNLLRTPSGGWGQKGRKREEFFQWAEAKVIKAASGIVSALSDNEAITNQRRIKSGLGRRGSTGDPGMVVRNGRFRWSRAVFQRTLGGFSASTGAKAHILVLILACVNRFLDQLYILLSWTKPPHRENLIAIVVWTFVCLYPAQAFQFGPPILMFLLVNTTISTKKKLARERNHRVFRRRYGGGGGWTSASEVSEPDLSGRSEVADADVPPVPPLPARIEVSEETNQPRRDSSASTRVNSVPPPPLPSTLSTSAVPRQVVHLLQRTGRIVEFVYQRRILVNVSKVYNALGVTVGVLLWIIISAKFPTFLVVYFCGIAPLVFFSPWVTSFRSQAKSRIAKEREQRLLLEQQTRAVAVYECQKRYGAGVGWVASTSTDEWPPWSADLSGQGQPYPVPSIKESPDVSPSSFDPNLRDDRRKWKWAPNFQWDYEVIGDLTDGNGWRYGTSSVLGDDPELSGLTNEATRKSDVRRRMWTRRAIIDNS